MPNVVESFFELLDNALKNKCEFLKKICQMTESITAHCNLTEKSLCYTEMLKKLRTLKSKNIYQIAILQDFFMILVLF